MLSTGPPINNIKSNTYANCYAMTFGGDYGFKDSTESMILSAHAESIILSAGGAESMMLLV
jgi:hypothetical protein